MAPIEPDLSNSNARPLAFLTAYGLVAAHVTVLVVRTLYRASRALPPSQATRSRQSHRRKHVAIFAALAALSLVVTGYYVFGAFLLSYRVWALQRGEVVPRHLWGEAGVFFAGEEEKAVDLQLGRWWRETDLITEFWELTTETSRRFWWTQQAFLGAAAWGVFVAIEGQRRRLPHLWAFILLSQFVGLSFAQNLFNIAILLTSVPLDPEGEHAHHHHLFSPSSSKTKSQARSHKRTRSKTKSSELRNELVTGAARVENAVHTRWDRLRDRVRRLTPEKSPLWTAHPALHLVPLAISYVSIFLLYYAPNTPSFKTVLFIPLILAYLPPLIHAFAPEKWGTTHASLHESHRAYLRVFGFISAISFLLHAKATVSAIIDNNSGSNPSHRHSVYYLFDAAQARLQGHPAPNESKFDHSKSTAGNIIRGLNDHPAVSVMGWDVLLSGVTLTVWAAVRGLDLLPTLFDSIGMSRIRKRVFAEVERAREHVAEAVEAERERVGNFIEKEREQLGNLIEKEREQVGRFIEYERQQVGHLAEKLGIHKSEEAQASSSSATRSQSSPAQRTRGKARQGRSKQSQSQSAAPEQDDLLSSSEDDEAYTATEKEASSLLLRTGAEDTSTDLESGAVAWTLFALGGLGLASGPVWGAEAAGR
ncbi:hypothetical protein L228DRAFT_266370 [Xylona heveae TC161]|uniref:Uncharacterized protein n=1 Tax=Xylona heveae (strain CBS 132557 / TC161) TaxID=1328760 RepID=A0A165HW12_XYLHT|nr:hypothetical protein L228DRAFT_266370 [Xylona heveae TC161]KZF24002.1 hypothetical protein L228DRAFT_266370 [Xylona heveae TC161]